MGLGGGYPASSHHADTWGGSIEGKKGYPHPLRLVSALGGFKGGREHPTGDEGLQITCPISKRGGLGRAEKKGLLKKKKIFGESETKKKRGKGRGVGLTRPKLEIEGSRKTLR